MEETLFQLKCIKEHLKFVSETTDKSVDFDIKALDGCINQIENGLELLKHLQAEKYRMQADFMKIKI